ncbi:hypothetical protein ACTOB_001132 [Actinoplanes oblitus]|uniref:Uncharacterized protein n=1 Tax=Actinoplanes oblitus TaxID=3040509 RepID=A0ABY8WJD3_9ACTN|nr:hypothetical protein [Actinoplanes oblitus]WIM97597.1 hypothetical protein ACTOB_001132 [Actinoplanes oblitus]
MTFPPDDPWGTPAPAPPGPPSSPATPPPAPAPAPPSPTGYPAVPPSSTGYPSAPPSPTGFPAVPPSAAGAAAQVPADPEPYASGPVIVQIAEIEITSSVIRTPAGDFPLSGSQWQVNDFWVTQRRTPAWAKIVGVAGVCFTAGFSLLLFLVKESVPQGSVQVTVTSGPRQYVARIPTHHERDVITINQQVNYVRSLAAL